MELKPVSVKFRPELLEQVRAYRDELHKNTGIWLTLNNLHQILVEYAMRSPEGLAFLKGESNE